MMEEMITASNLTRYYGSHLAVDDLSFSVKQGEIVGFLGPNGAGKSTTLRMLAGYLDPTSGSVTVGGFDTVTQSLAARAVTGYMPESVPLYGEMRVAEYLRFRAELKGVKATARAGMIDEVMLQTQLADVARSLIQTLSKGYRQRVGIADALLGSPPLLILDEPTAGLDPNQVVETRALIRSLGGKHTVLVSTHILTEVEAVCSRMIIIANGRLVAQGTGHEIRAMGTQHANEIEFMLRGTETVIQTIIAGVPTLLSSTTEALDKGVFRLIVHVPNDEQTVESHIEALNEKFVTGGIAVRSIRARERSLEDVFSDLTRTPAPTVSPASTATETSAE